MTQEIINKEINIVEILKECPEGTVLYTPMFGNVELLSANAKNVFPILVRLQDNTMRGFTKEGKFKNVGTDGECVLFPSKDNRDWTTFKAPKKEYEFKPFEKGGMQ